MTLVSELIRRSQNVKVLENHALLSHQELAAPMIPLVNVNYFVLLLPNLVKSPWKKVEVETETETEELIMTFQ